MVFQPSELTTLGRPMSNAELTAAQAAEAEAPAFSPNTVNDEVLWLARAIYSETKRPEEQELVAWVIRNRVETEYRGQVTFRGAVLDPFQFSAFNPGSAKRRHYTNLTPTSRARGWTRALEIAHNVYYAASEERPFPRQTRHFYSERSMLGGAPDWARGKTPIRVTTHRIDARRFRFYASIA
ncbi:MAG: hypothetical protein HKN04_07795 [Rhodothermaceae bacterium]|nr:hypothetical protein [Rhodothermaceae bacterium]